MFTPCSAKPLFEDFDCFCLSYVFWQFIPGWYNSVEERIRLYFMESIAAKVWSQLKVVSSVWSRSTGNLVWDGIFVVIINVLVKLDHVAKLSSKLERRKI